MDKAGSMANSTMEGVNNTVGEAKQQFMNMLKNKNKWGVIYLCLVIVFLIWLLSLIYKGKVGIKSRK